MVPMLGPLLAIILMASISPKPGRALQIGQEWEFTARPGDPHPTLVIVRMDSLPKVGEVIHVSIRGVRLRNPRAPGGYSDQMAHMPFSRTALEGSLTRLLHESVPLPDFEDGYAQWKSARGGAFAISVREALDFMEKTLSQ